MYCEDCKYFQPLLKDVTMHPFFHRDRCYCPENAHLDEEKNSKYPDALFGSYAYGDYIADVTILDRKPRQINKNNDCAWFQVCDTRWWEIKKKRRIVWRYGK